MTKEAPKILYKVTKRITVPLCALQPGIPIPFKFAGEPPRMVQIDNKPDKDGNSKKPATCLRATRLDTGEIVDLIASTVLLSQIDREYGGHEEQIAGRNLLLESTGKRTGKNYNDVRIDEISMV